MKTKLKSLTMINWQKHAHLHLVFNDGLNVITGLSNSGKSCIRRAVGWLFFNTSISENDYRREGTDETSVGAVLNNGFGIERIRTNSINRYILRHKDFEDKVFDSFGKNIPEEIQQVINMSEIEADNEKVNLNISEQLTLPFLLDKPATFRSKLFNKLTGNEILDKTFKELNKEHLRVIREIKDTEKNIEKQEEQLGDYSIQYKDSKKKLNLVKTKYEDLLEQVEIYENLKELSEVAETINRDKEFIEFKKSKIIIISGDMIKALKDKATLLEKYESLNVRLSSINCAINDIKKQKEGIKITDVDLTELKVKNESLQKLRQLNKQLDGNIEKADGFNLDRKGIANDLKLDEEALKEIWAKCETCPLCKHRIDNETTE